MLKYNILVLNSLYLASLKWSKLIHVMDSGLTTLSAFSAKLLRDSELSTDGTILLNYLNPALFIVLLNNNDNPTLIEAMNDPDSTGFMSAKEKEIETLITKQAFVIIYKELWMHIVSSVWAFRRKRIPHGTNRKLKARICARVFKQKEGIEYFETFAPSVQWMTVCVCRIMIILLNLHNKQIDYTAAFLQAPLDHDVYVKCLTFFQAPVKYGYLKELFKD